MEAVREGALETGARVLVVDDEAVIREGVRRALEKAGIAVDTCASGFLALELMQKKSFDLVLSDLKMPGMSGLELLTAIKGLQPDVPVIIITGYSTVDTAVEAMRNGAFDYIPKPFEPTQILEKTRSALAQRAMRLEKAAAPLPEVREHGLERMIGESPEMQKVYKRILQVAPTDSTVLITGESGTGKELVARATHGNSGRRGKPFVAVDCTSLAENLLESELFGHVKGSFTGAIQTKTGLFKVADGGTLFLDEIAHVSLTTQAKLLRVLQQREVTPIGGTTPQPIDIRLIAATNRNLRTLVSEGTFREDLFFRLNIIPIDLPPLRQRKGDKHLLIRHFLRHFSEEMGKEIRGITPEALALLDDYPFPGNVRELQASIERAVVLCCGDQVESRDLELQEAETKDGEGVAAHVPLNAEELKETKRLIRESAVEPVEKAFALNALERNNWNVTRAAEETGMQRPNFQALVKKLGISIKGQRCN